MTITHKEIVEILSHLEGSSCEEFNLHIDGVDLMLRRKVDEPNALSSKKISPSRSQPREAVEKTALPKQELSKQQVSLPPAQIPTNRSDFVELRAPMSGVFYRRPSPDEPSFVEVGDEVKEGDPLCVIEVMKLFSTFYSSCSGRVAMIHVEDSTNIERSQVLITIDSSQ
jgi:acetyl-CoA carboxylase biotin carboxyl carrier protein